MNYWWVNQNKTLKFEVEGGFLWSPKTNIKGKRNPFYDFMKEVKKEDIIFSYANQKISHIGIALGEAYSYIKPEDFDGQVWDKLGWKVPVRFFKLDKALIPKQHIESIRENLPNKYSPLRASGDGREFYLTELSQKLGMQIQSLLDGEVEKAIELYKESDLDISLSDDENNYQVEEIEQRTDIGPTEKVQLVKARTGQGIYKKNLIKVEKGCRLTGVKDSKYLIASHIKPWADSDDFEKLDGNNGLLLSPHYDKLFDKGLISFEDNGDILVSPKISKEVIHLWDIDLNANVGQFNSYQIEYLGFHRKKIFKN